MWKKNFISYCLKYFFFFLIDWYFRCSFSWMFCFNGISSKTNERKILFHQPSFPKYFNLKRKPKAAALRADLVARSVDAQANVKKSQLPTVPVRTRGLPRNSDTSNTFNIIYKDLFRNYFLKNKFLKYITFSLYWIHR